MKYGLVDPNLLNGYYHPRSKSCTRMDPTYYK